MSSEGQSNRVHHISSLCQQLKHQYECQKLCDVTLSCEQNEELQSNEQVIECHKLILVSASKYFEDIILSQDQNNIIKISPININVAKEVINYMYNGECVIESENVLDILKVSKKWKIQQLINKCSNYMKKNININNAICFYEAHDSDVLSLKDELSLFIREHFSTLCDLNLFEDISVENFIAIIKHDKLNAKSEDQILEVLIKLSEHRGTIIPPECFDTIRFEYLSNDYMINMISHPLIKEDPEQNYNKKVFKLLANKPNDKHNVAKRMLFNQLICIKKDGFVYVKEGINKGVWGKRIKIPDWINEWTTIIYDKGILICAGAETKDEKGNKLISMINVYSNELIQLPDLSINTYIAGVLYTGQYIYIFGGFREGSHSNVANRLSLIDNLWVDLPPMPAKTSQSLIVQLNNYIYVVGGWDRKPVKCLQRYDTNTCTWALLKDIPTTNSCSNNKAGVVLYQDNIVVITKTECLIYNIERDDWLIKRYDNIDDVCNAIIFNNDIMSLVIEDDKNVVKIYDIDDNKWIRVDLEINDIYRRRFFFAC